MLMRDMGLEVFGYKKFFSFFHDYPRWYHTDDMNDLRTTLSNASQIYHKLDTAGLIPSMGKGSIPACQSIILSWLGPDMAISLRFYSEPAPDGRHYFTYWVRDPNKISSVAHIGDGTEYHSIVDYPIPSDLVNAFCELKRLNAVLQPYRC